jgi:hypothetical protein
MFATKNSSQHAWKEMVMSPEAARKIVHLMNSMNVYGE